MARNIRLIKSDFTSGEVDPKLKARTDIKHYFSGAELLKNVVVLPQGGFKRREGLEFVQDVTTLTGGNDADDGARWVSFEFSTTVTYALLFLDQEVRIFKDGAQVHTITTGIPWTGAELANINWVQSADTLIIFHPDVQPKTFVRVSDVSWTVANLTFDSIPQFDYTPSSSTPSGSVTPSATSGQIKLTGSGTTFAASYEGQQIEGNGGLVRVEQFNSTTELVCTVIIPFFNIDAIANPDWTFHEGFEDVWSGSRGWPACGSFHDGRLWVGGGPRPSTLWGSRVGQFFDFAPGTGLDADAIDATLDTDQLNSIINILSLRDLVIFTTGGEFNVAERPITPNNFNAVTATRRGSATGQRPAELDGAALFVQRGGKAIREFIFVEAEQSFVADNLSLLASHIIDTPVDFNRRRATATEENDLIILVNNDGTAVLASVIRSQQVVAWSRMTTGGTIMRVGIDDTDVYFLVKRTVDSADAWYVEKFNSDHLLDSSVRVTSGFPSATITAAHLDNETVDIMADGAYMGQETLNGSGVHTLSRDVQTEYEAGYDFDVQADTLPIEPGLPEGTAIGTKKRVVEVTLELLDTTNILVNDRVVPFKQFGIVGSGSPLDVAPEVFTGRKTVEGFLGYDEKGAVSITQNIPGQLNVLGIAAKVAI